MYDDLNSIRNSIDTLVRANAPDTVYRKLDALAHTIGVDQFRETVVKEIIAKTRPDRIIPDMYRHFRPLVCDGIQFFLSQLPLRRLLDVVVSQLMMADDCTTYSRLVMLAKQFPTLHKLGQIISRNQHIDSEVKQCLIPLENGCYGTLPDTLISHINERLALRNAPELVRVEPFILAEASVGAVVPFQWQPDCDRPSVSGLFKVLKPKIKEKLTQELNIFGKMARFFEDRRHRYALKNFRFLQVIEDVRDILSKEIDLIAEQSYLAQAHRFYENIDEIVVPRVLPFSDNTMTAMAYIPGDKVTDASLSEKQRRQCAHLLMASLICKPLFSDRDAALFHGDPHPGNILKVENTESGALTIALLDWSLAGYLHRSMRIEIVGLIQSILTDNRNQMYHSIQNLMKPLPDGSLPSGNTLHRMILTLVSSDAYADFKMVKRAFWLLEQLSYEGIVFPSDILLFRKSLFTLEGVLLDIYPKFDMDSFFFNYMAGLLTDEMPKRLSCFFFLQADKPENYRSLLSNGDLQVLVLHQSMSLFRNNTLAAVSLFEKQALLMNRFWG